MRHNLPKQIYPIHVCVFSALEYIGTLFMHYLAFKHWFTGLDVAFLAFVDKYEHRVSISNSNV